MKLNKLGKTGKSAIKNFALKPISMVLGLAYTPILLAYLGNEQYGVWVTMLSIINWINNCDVGIGNGLRNILSKSIAEKDYDKAKRAISTAFICLTFIAAGLLIISVVLTFSVDWKILLNTTIDARVPILISVIFICVNFVLAIVNTVLHALQKSELVSLQGILSQVLVIVGLLFLKSQGQGNLLYMSLLFGFSTTLVHCCTCFVIFRNETLLSPKLKLFDRKLFNGIFSLGIKFFIAQIAAVVLFTTDNLLVSHFFGAENVTPFSLADKVFSVGYTCFSAITVPFWSKTTRDIALHDLDSIKKNHFTLKAIACLFAVGCVIVALIFKPVVGIWLNKSSVEFTNEIIWIMCVYYAVYAFSTVTSTFINGMNGVNGVMILGIIQGVVNIPLSIILARNCGMGVIGIRMGTLIVLAGGEIFQLIYYSRLLKSLEKENKIKEI